MKKLTKMEEIALMQSIVDISNILHLSLNKLVAAISLVADGTHSGVVFDRAIETWNTVASIDSPSEQLKLIEQWEQE